MPYKIQGNSVFKDLGDGKLELVKSHPSREQALAHFRALKINVDLGLGHGNKKKKLALRKKSKSRKK